ncbi:hypothetical protein ACH5RR_028282, partial [Cinchona calisaya]
SSNCLCWGRLLICDAENLHCGIMYLDLVESISCLLYDLARMVWTTKGEIQETAKDELINCFKLLEAELGDKSYFGGKTFGITDIAFIPYYCWFHTLEKFGNFSMDDECPKLVTWDDVVRFCRVAEEVEIAKSDFVSTTGKESSDASVNESMACVNVSPDVSIGEGNASGSSDKQAIT